MKAIAKHFFLVYHMPSFHVELAVFESQDYRRDKTTFHIHPYNKYEKRVA